MPIVIAYWKIRGLLQLARYMLEYSGLEYTQKLYETGPAPEFNMDDWLSEKFKLGLPFPNLPYVIDGDVKLTQSTACYRYIARKTNLLGTNEAEGIRCDFMGEISMDLRNFMVGYFYNPKFEELKPGFLKAADDRLKSFSAYLGNNKWFAGENLTFPDFHMYELMDQLRTVEPTILDKYQNLKDLMARFEALPAIAAYQKSDRFMSHPINNKQAAFGNA